MLLSSPSPKPQPITNKVPKRIKEKGIWADTIFPWATTPPRSLYDPPLPVKVDQVDSKIKVMG